MRARRRSDAHTGIARRRLHTPARPLVPGFRTVAFGVGRACPARARRRAPERQRRARLRRRLGGRLALLLRDLLLADARVHPLRRHPAPRRLRPARPRPHPASSRRVGLHGGPRFSARRGSGGRSPSSVRVVALRIARLGAIVISERDRLLAGLAPALIQSARWASSTSSAPDGRSLCRRVPDSARYGSQSRRGRLAASPVAAVLLARNEPRSQAATPTWRRPRAADRGCLTSTRSPRDAFALETSPPLGAGVARA